MNQNSKKQNCIIGCFCFKNRKRGELRRLMRRNVTKNATARNYLKNVRSEYRQGDRRERCFYWEARLLPGKFPEMYLTSISDEATQADYVLPRMIDLDLNRKCIQMKLVATIYHGHCIVLHVVRSPEHAGRLQPRLSLY